jgi:hypothetical protein
MATKSMSTGRSKPPKMARVWRVMRSKTPSREAALAKSAHAVSPVASWRSKVIPLLGSAE